METFKNFFYYSTDIPRGLGVKNFSTTHFAWLCVTSFLIIIIIYRYRKLPIKTKQKIITAFAISLMISEILRTVWAISIGHYSVDSMLPLHLCGVMVFVEFFAVFSKKQLLKEFAYSCGLPGAFVGLLTPEASGYPLLSFRYLIYIISHGLLVIIPLLWVFGDGFRPNIKYFLKSFGMLCFLAVFDSIVNFKLNSNYLFIHRAPVHTPLETFDKWVGYPGYVGVLFICALLVVALMYIPWAVKSNTVNIKKLSTAHNKK